MSNPLADYLRGAVPMTEAFSGSSVLGSITGQGAMTSREERLKTAWGDSMVKFEAILLDLIEADPQVYEDAINLIQDVRSLTHTGVRQAHGLFAELIRFLDQKKGGSRKADDLEAVIGHFKALKDDLAYISDQYDPVVPRPPEIPPMDRSAWDQMHGQGGDGAAEMPDTADRGEEEIHDAPGATPGEADKTAAGPESPDVEPGADGEIPDEGAEVGPDGEPVQVDPAHADILQWLDQSGAEGPQDPGAEMQDGEQGADEEIPPDGSGAGDHGAPDEETGGHGAEEPGEDPNGAPEEGDGSQFPDQSAQPPQARPQFGQHLAADSPDPSAGAGEQPDEEQPDVEDQGDQEQGDEGEEDEDQEDPRRRPGESLIRSRRPVWVEHLGRVALRFGTKLASWGARPNASGHWAILKSERGGVAAAISERIISLFNEDAPRGVHAHRARIQVGETGGVVVILQPTEEGQYDIFKGKNRARFAAGSAPARPPKPVSFKASTGLKTAHPIKPVESLRALMNIGGEPHVFDEPGLLSERDFAAKRGGKFDQAKHPRKAKGHEGGRFAKGSGGSSSSSTKGVASKKPPAKKAGSQLGGYGTHQAEIRGKSPTKSPTFSPTKGKPPIKGKVQKSATGKPPTGKKPIKKVAKAGQAAPQKPQKSAKPPASKVPAVRPDQATAWSPEHDTDFRETMAQAIKSPKVPQGVKDTIAQIATEYRQDFEGGQLQAAPAAQAPPAAGAPPPAAAPPAPQGQQQTAPAVQQPPAPAAPAQPQKDIRPNPDLDALFGDDEQKQAAAQQQPPQTATSPADPGASVGSVPGQALPAPRPPDAQQATAQAAAGQQPAPTKPKGFSKFGQGAPPEQAPTGVQKPAPTEQPPEDPQAQAPPEQQAPPAQAPPPVAKPPQAWDQKAKAELAEVSKHLLNPNLSPENRVTLLTRQKELLKARFQGNSVKAAHALKNFITNLVVGYYQLEVGQENPDWEAIVPKPPANPETGEESNLWDGIYDGSAPQGGEQAPPVKGKKPPPQESVDGQALVYDSLILASLADATLREGGADLDELFLQAGEAIRIAMEEHTDVASAHVECGACAPGNPPRLDVFVEWVVNERPSDTFGYARLYWNGSSLAIRDANDRTVKTVESSPDITDEAVAEAIYRSLTVCYDPSTSRTWHRSNVSESIFRLIRYVRAGQKIPDSVWAQIIVGLRTLIGEKAGVIPSRVALMLDEAESHDSGVLNFYFAWPEAQPIPIQVEPLGDELRDPLNITPGGGELPEPTVDPEGQGQDGSIREAFEPREFEAEDLTIGMRTSLGVVKSTEIKMDGVAVEYDSGRLDFYEPHHKVRVISSGPNYFESSKSETSYRFHKTFKYVRGGIYVAGLKGEKWLEVQLVDADAAMTTLTLHVLKPPDGMADKYPVGKVMKVSRSDFHRMFKWVKPPNAFEGIGQPQKETDDPWVMDGGVVTAKRGPHKGKVVGNIEFDGTLYTGVSPNGKTTPALSSPNSVARMLWVQASLQKESDVRYKTGRAIRYWRSGGITIDQVEGKAWTVWTELGEVCHQEIKDGDDDESIAANLYTAAHQEARSTGHVIEGLVVLRKERYRVDETMGGAVLVCVRPMRESVSGDEIMKLAGLAGTIAYQEALVRISDAFGAPALKNHEAVSKIAKGVAYVVETVPGRVAGRIQSLRTLDLARMVSAMYTEGVVAIDEVSKWLDGHLGMAEAKLTPGMVNYHRRTHADDAWHTCSGCDFPIPHYPGRYPRFCPNCGCDMVHQATYPSKYLKPPTPEPPLADEVEGYVPLRERLQLRDWANDACQAISAKGSWPIVPWSPNRRVLHVERVDPLTATLHVYPPFVESVGRLIESFTVPTWTLTDQVPMVLRVNEVLKAHLQREAVKGVTSPQSPTIGGGVDLPIEGVEEGEGEDQAKMAYQLVQHDTTIDDFDLLLHAYRGAVMAKDKKVGSSVIKKLRKGGLDDFHFATLVGQMGEALGGGVGPDFGASDGVSTTVGEMDGGAGGIGLDTHQGTPGMAPFAASHNMVTSPQGTRKKSEGTLTEPGFVKTAGDEEKWKKAKAAAGKNGGETKWALANHIFHKMKGEGTVADTIRDFKLREAIWKDGTKIGDYQVTDPAVVWPIIKQTLGAEATLAVRQPELRKIVSGFKAKTVDQKTHRLVNIQYHHHEFNWKGGDIWPEEKIQGLFDKLIAAFTQHGYETYLPGGREGHSLTVARPKLGLGEDIAPMDYTSVQAPSTKAEDAPADAEKGDLPRVSKSVLLWAKVAALRQRGVVIPAHLRDRNPYSSESTQETPDEDMISPPGTHRPATVKNRKGKDVLLQTIGDPGGMSGTWVGEELEPTSGAWVCPACGAEPGTNIDCPRCMKGSYKTEGEMTDEHQFKCAWCGKMFGSALAPDSHGICPDCYEKQKAELKARRKTPKSEAEAGIPSFEEFRKAHPVFQAAVKNRDAAQQAIHGGDRWGDTRRFQGRTAGNQLAALDAARLRWSRAWDKAAADYEKTYGVKTEGEMGGKAYKAAVAIILNDQDEVLMGRARADDDRQGKWCFPGGHIDDEDGNDLNAAATREAYEEMGVRAQPIGTPFDHPSKPDVGFVICRYQGGDVCVNHEYTMAQWFPLKVAADDLDDIYPPNKVFLQRVIAELGTTKGGDPKSTDATLEARLREDGGEKLLADFIRKYGEDGVWAVNQVQRSIDKHPDSMSGVVDDWPEILRVAKTLISECLEAKRPLPAGIGMSTIQARVWKAIDPPGTMIEIINRVKARAARSMDRSELSGVIQRMVQAGHVARLGYLTSGDPVYGYPGTPKPAGVHDLADLEKGSATEARREIALAVLEGKVAHPGQDAKTEDEFVKANLDAMRAVRQGRVNQAKADIEAAYRDAGTKVPVGIEPWHHLAAQAKPSKELKPLLITLRVAQQDLDADTRTDELTHRRVWKRMHPAEAAYIERIRKIRRAASGKMPDHKEVRNAEGRIRQEEKTVGGKILADGGQDARSRPDGDVLALDGFHGARVRKDSWNGREDHQGNARCSPVDERREGSSGNGRDARLRQSTVRESGPSESGNAGGEHAGHGDKEALRPSFASSERLHEQQREADRKRRAGDSQAAGSRRGHNVPRSQVPSQRLIDSENRSPHPLGARLTKEGLDKALHVLEALVKSKPAKAVSKDNLTGGDGAEPTTEPGDSFRRSEPAVKPVEIPPPVDPGSPEVRQAKKLDPPAPALDPATMQAGADVSKAAGQEPVGGEDAAKGKAAGGKAPPAKGGGAAPPKKGGGEGPPKPAGPKKPPPPAQPAAPPGPQKPPPPAQAGGQPPPAAGQAPPGAPAPGGKPPFGGKKPAGGAPPAGEAPPGGQPPPAGGDEEEPDAGSVTPEQAAQAMQLQGQQALPGMPAPGQPPMNPGMPGQQAFPGQVPGAQQPGMPGMQQPGMMPGQQPGQQPGAMPGQPGQPGMPGQQPGMPGQMQAAGPYGQPPPGGSATQQTVLLRFKSAEDADKAAGWFRSLNIQSQQQPGAVDLYFQVGDPVTLGIISKTAGAFGLRITQVQ